MNIAFDATPLVGRLVTGVGWCEANLTAALRKLHPEQQYRYEYFAARNAAEKHRRMESYCDAQTTLRTSKFPPPVYRAASAVIPMPYQAFFGKWADITHFFNYIVPPAVHGKTVVTVHDMVLHAYPETMHTRTRVLLELELSRSLQRADLVVTDSEFSRREIETYLKDIGQQYVTDSTNNEDEAVRNRIRHHVLPLLETINPSVRKSLSDTAHRMAEADKVLQRALDDAQSRLLETDGSDALPNKKIDVVELLKEPSPEYVLFHLLAPFQFTPDTIEDIASYMMNKGTSTTGKMWVSATHQMFLNRGKLLIAERNEEYSLRLRIPEPGVYGYTDVDGREHRIRVSLNEWKRGMNPSRSTSCVTLDSVDISFPLTLRYVAEGDRFVPFGMTGSKLISNFLTDQKRSIPEKRRQLVVENADGNLLWLLNNRPDNRYRCTSSTRSVIVLEDVSNH